VLLLVACAGPSDSPETAGETARESAQARDSTGESGETAAETARESGGETAAETGETGIDTGETGTIPEPHGGPCTAYAEALAVSTVQDPALNELSGLAPSRRNPGILWTHEDSGGAAELYALDTLGATVATLTLEGVTNTDWEDIALGPCGDDTCLYVGDIGDLGTDRSEFAVLVVPEPVLDGTPALSAKPEVRPFTYPGEPEDAEGLTLTADGDPLIVTKRTDATAGLYRLPAGETVLDPLADIATGAEGEDLTARATAADLWLDPPVLLVRTYLHLATYDATDLTAPGEPEALAFALELQGEAVAWDVEEGGFWQVGEGSEPTLWYTACAE
jgi:hypothetical protein